MAYILQAMGTKGYENAFEVALHPDEFYATLLNGMVQRGKT